MRFFNKYFFIGLASGVALTIAVIAVGGYILFTMMTVDPKMAEENLPAPDFPPTSQRSIYGQADYGWKFRTLDGKDVMLSEFKDKVVFINLWATWCKPCVYEMPSIQTLYDSLKNEEVAFLLISDETEETIRKFMAEKNYTFPVYLRSEELPTVFKTMGIPATFILSRDGAVVFKHVGSAKWDDVSSLKFIRELM